MRVSLGAPVGARIHTPPPRRRSRTKCEHTHRERKELVSARALRRGWPYYPPSTVKCRHSNDFPQRLDRSLDPLVVHVQVGDGAQPARPEVASSSPPAPRARSGCGRVRAAHPPGAIITMFVSGRGRRQPRQRRRPRGQPPRAVVVLREAREVVPERVQPRRREEARLTHPPAEAAPHPPGPLHGLRRCPRAPSPRARPVPSRGKPSPCRRARPRRASAARPPPPRWGGERRPGGPPPPAPWRTAATSAIRARGRMLPPGAVVGVLQADQRGARQVAGTRADRGRDLRGREVARLRVGTARSWIPPQAAAAASSQLRM